MLQYAMLTVLEKLHKTWQITIAWKLKNYQEVWQIAIAINENEIRNWVCWWEWMDTLLSVKPKYNIVRQALQRTIDWNTENDDIKNNCLILKT